MVYLETPQKAAVKLYDCKAVRICTHPSSVGESTQNEEPVGRATFEPPGTAGCPRSGFSDLGNHRPENLSRFALEGHMHFRVTSGWAKVQLEAEISCHLERRSPRRPESKDLRLLFGVTHGMVRQYGRRPCQTTTKSSQHFADHFSEKRTIKNIDLGKRDERSEECP